MKNKKNIYNKISFDSLFFKLRRYLFSFKYFSVYNHKFLVNYITRSQYFKTKSRDIIKKLEYNILNFKNISVALDVTWYQLQRVTVHAIAVMYGKHQLDFAQTRTTCASRSKSSREDLCYLRRTIYITGITCLTCTLYLPSCLSITLCSPWRVVAHQTESSLLRRNLTDSILSCFEI